MAALVDREPDGELLATLVPLTMLITVLAGCDELAVAQDLCEAGRRAAARRGDHMAATVMAWYAARCGTPRGTFIGPWRVRSRSMTPYTPRGCCPSLVLRRTITYLALGRPEAAANALSDIDGETLSGQLAYECILRARGALRLVAGDHALRRQRIWRRRRPHGELRHLQPGRPSPRRWRGPGAGQAGSVSNGLERLPAPSTNKRRRSALPEPRGGLYGCWRDSIAIPPGFGPPRICSAAPERSAPGPGSWRTWATRCSSRGVLSPLAGHTTRPLDLADRGGAVPLAARSREGLRRAGARPRRARVRGIHALTPAERRTADLAARGLTNAAVADQLFVSVKTVEGHLRAAYRKLGIARRRGEAATAAALRRASTPGTLH